MSKRNKLRYQSQGNQFPTIILTGKVFLRYIDEETISTAVKGDLMIFISTDSLKYNTRVGDYEAMGYEGYLKADVHDGKKWNPLSLEEFFSEREYYFGKRERPIDTYHLCLPIFKALGGTELIRTYREHYVKAPEGSSTEEDAEK